LNSSRLDPPPVRLDSPSAREAVRIIRTLRDHGHVAYLAGGCVRDALLGKTPKDYDVATDATPETVRKVFGRRNTLAFGAAFGVIGVLPERAQPTTESPTPESPTPAKVEPIEVATFRSDGAYSDGRRPDSVSYGCAAADAARRDFTINGLFFDPATEQIIDFVGGRDDLWARRLRTIGDPHARFAEDKLRMLRAIRFATTLQFDIDAATHDAIRRHAADIDVVSGERIGTEMRKTLACDHAADGLRMLGETHLDQSVWPELGYADEASWRKRLASRPSVPEGVSDFVVALALVLTTSRHATRDLKGLRDRWRLSTDEVRTTTRAIEEHEALMRADELPWSSLQPRLIDRDIATTLAVAEAVAVSENGSRDGIRRCKTALQRPVHELNPPPLLTGQDLLAMNIPAGPAFKRWLHELRSKQLDGELTDRNEAIAWLDRERNTST